MEILISPPNVILNIPFVLLKIYQLCVYFAFFFIVFYKNVTLLLHLALLTCKKPL